MSDEPKAAPGAEPQEDPPPASYPPVLVQGDVVGEYVIDRLIAAGGMAQIFAAHHEFTLRVVAIKTPVRKLAEGSVGYQRMMAEARALGEIEHPNIVRIHHAGRDPKVGLYIVMELLEGKNLRELMRWTGGLPVLDSIRYAIEIAMATHALHGLGIFHRDIKPENVFITKGRTLKLLDLGAAKIEKYGARTTGNMGTVGTTAYMSPEHLSFKPITAASDVYSLGVMAYEMLAKKHMFLVHRTTATPQEFRQWHLFAPPEPLNQVVDGVSAETAQVIARALEKEPADRYPDMEAFGNALRAALTREMDARSVAAAIDPAGADEPAKKGKFGTDLMVPQIKVADLRAKTPPTPAAAPAKAHVTPRTIRMDLVTRTQTPPAALAARPSPEAVAQPRASLQATPSPLTLDDPAPSSRPKIALAVLVGLLVAVVAVVGLQLRTATPSSLSSAATVAPGLPAPAAAPAPPAATEENPAEAEGPATEPTHSTAPVQSASGHEAFAKPRGPNKPAPAETAKPTAAPTAERPTPRPIFD